jgi:hypothetical protein
MSHPGGPGAPALLVDDKEKGGILVCRVNVDKVKMIALVPARVSEGLRSNRVLKK